MDVHIIQIEYDKYKYFDHIGPRKAHNGEQISLVSLSPNGRYVVTYSYNDNSIEGWDVVNSKLVLTLEEINIKLPKESGFIDDIKINNSEIICYVLGSETKTFQMPNIKSPIRLNPPPKMQWPRINFTKNGNLAIFDNNKILVYSTHGKMLSSHELLLHNEVIRGVSIDENDNIWVISPNYLFHWDLAKFRFKFSYSLGFTAYRIDEVDERFTVISKGNSIVIKYNNEIAIFSEGVHFPIQNIKLKGTNIKKIELCKIQNDYLLAFNLPEKYENQNIFLYHITDINKQPIDVSEIFNKGHSDKLYEYNSDLEKAFGLVNGEFSCINVDFDQEFLDKVFFGSHDDYDDDYDDFVGWNNYLYQGSQRSYCNDTLAFPDMENLRKLVSKNCEYIDENEDIDFKNQKYKWRIDLKNKKLSVVHDQGILDSKNLDDNSWNLKWNWKILNNNALALRYYGNCTGDTVIIYNYDIKNKKIKIEYYYYKKGLVKINKEEFSKSILPIASDITDLDKDKIKIISNIISNIIEDDRCLAKYGQTLLPILIESSDSDLTCRMEDIYKKCMKLVKEDPKRNLKFLNIITSSMNKLYKSHFDYITRFNSEMFMILNPFNEWVNNGKDRSHFHTFSQEMAIIETRNSKFFKLFQSLISFDLTNTLRSFLISRKTIQYITLIVPYVDYSRYPSEYTWWKELFYPPSSVFIKTCKKKEFYTNWNGEAVIKFKWKTFGKAYYCLIWLLFMVFLVCFTIASYPTNSITKEIRIKLYQTSTVFGIFHLTHELRQFALDKKKYFFSRMNFFELSTYLSATIASIYWIKHDNIPDWALSISCLLLDLKFLLFFRAFEYTSIIFAIMFGVAKRVLPFLAVLAIIIASFAHAFFLLLHPENLLDSLKAQNPNDPNNPWTLSNTYNQVNENGNETLIIQVPSENTNLFYSYPTSLLATYLFLIGNQNSFSPWSPKPTIENAILFILMTVFSFIIVIYLMNLIIGLLGDEIKKNNDHALYYVQKAEIIAEIELFYLLPHQRRRRTWFPEIIYYSVSVEKARKHIREAIINGEWKMNDWPEMKQKISMLLSMDDTIVNQAV
ncbi:hypothetical protein RhiirA4_548963 [Rhizophagus irregularis]|uniref:Ion transport domain-containing protein n=1 Tax=Rhizophagus irregularis TaxID=588596 RepID=A0A2I1HAI6_9GLOM|nr:hypothetical protein RhiirA4_548963 [Rhizophagus irregularis]